MTEQQEDKKGSIDDYGQSWMRWTGVGIEFCVVILVFMWLGDKLDKMSDPSTSPGFMIMGFLVGFAVMLYTMFKRAGGMNAWREGHEKSQESGAKLSESKSDENKAEER